MKSILLIDDSADYRETAACVLSEAGYEVWEADSPCEAFQILKDENFDLIVCDLHLPVTTGVDKKEFVTSHEVGVRTIRELREIFKRVPIIAMSNTAPSDLKKISVIIDPIPTYTKPFHSEEIIEIIDSHINLIGGQQLVQ